MQFQPEGIRGGKTQTKFSEVKHILSLQPTEGQSNACIPTVPEQRTFPRAAGQQPHSSYQAQVTLRVFQGFFYIYFFLSFCLAFSLATITKQKINSTEFCCFTTRLYVIEAQKNPLPSTILPHP